MKIILTLALTLFIAHTQAQPPAVNHPGEKTSEIGIIFSNLNSFGLTFRTGNTNALWRFNALSVHGSLSAQEFDSLIIRRPQMGGELTLGREYRKHLSDKFALRVGGDVGFMLNRSVYELDDLSIWNNDTKTVDLSYIPKVAFVFGFNYALCPSVLLGFELLPSASYSVTQQTITGPGFEQKSTSAVFNYGLHSTSGLLSLVYRLR